MFYNYEPAESGTILEHWSNLVPETYVLVRQQCFSLFFKDIFTETKYLHFKKRLGNEIIVARLISPIISNQERISYKDAEEILRTKNTCISRNKTNKI